MNLVTSEKHYNTLSNYYKKRFNAKVCKIMLNGNFTCPNRDGSLGYGGCKFCSLSGSGEFAGNKLDSFEKQFSDIKETMNKKWPNAKYIAYLQAYSNTYAPLNTLKEMYEKIINLDKNIVMLSIATRADCLDDAKIEYLANLNKRIPVEVEIGLQSIKEESNKNMNMCHNLLDIKSKVMKLRKNNIEVIVHIINGLPGETKSEMLETVKFVNSLGINGIKIHSLCIIKNTRLALDYQKRPFPIMSLDEYVDITVTQIRNLDKNIIIHRLSADAKKEELIAPLWTQKKFVVMNEIDKYMRKHNFYQGDLL